MERFLVDSEIFHAVKAGTQSFMLQSRNKSLVFAIAFSLTLFLLFALIFLLSMYLLFITSIILNCHFSLSQSRKQLSTSTHYLEEYRGEVLEPFVGNPASLLDLS